MFEWSISGFPLFIHYIIYFFHMANSHLSSMFSRNLRFTILTPLWTSMTGDSDKAFTA